MNRRALSVVPILVLLAVSAAFLRLADFECGVRLLATQYPELVEMVSLGKSAAGHDVWDVRLSDRTIDDADKEKLLVVSSIHGNEIGARKGAARQIENLLDPRFEANEDWVGEVLATHVIHFVFPTPDGWVRGDVVGADGSGLAWTRANTGSRDLNRNFPVTGWINPSNAPLDQPESQLVDTLLRSSDAWSLGTDNHGQIHAARAADRSLRPADRRGVRLPEVRDPGPLR